MIRQCKRCEKSKWFPDDGSGPPREGKFARTLEESRHICRDCFPHWLDEQWALDQVQPRQS